MGLRAWLARDVERRLDAMSSLLVRSHGAILAAVEETRRQVMAGQAEIEQAIQDVKASVAAETDRVEAVIAALKAGGDLAPQIAELESIKQALDAVEAPPAPAP